MPKTPPEAIDKARAAREAFQLITDSLQKRSEGLREREHVVMDMADAGFNPPTISRALAQQARDMGLDEKQIEALGISEHNVRIIIREVTHTRARMGEGR